MYKIEEYILNDRELKIKTISGFVYKFAERAGAQGINFLISIILARILLAEDYGVVALVTVFISICDVFVTYGFGNSLIVDKDSDQLDFSTCFFFGIGLSIVVYGFAYFSAPVLARFYENDMLTPLIRVMGLRIILASVNSVQHAYVSKHMLFKKFFYSTLVGTVVSGIIAAIMAYAGYGVWALVAQYLGNVIIDTIILWIIVKWRPTCTFSFFRLKKIYKYGWKILVTGLVDTGYQQLRSLVIGKRYSSADLAYYNKGLMFPIFTNKLIEPTVNTVLFPALSKSNDSKEQMKDITRRVVRVATYFLAPVMVGLFVIAEPMVTVLLTERWLPCVIFLRIGCVAYFVRPLMYIGDSIIKASGRSDLLLKLDSLSKVIGIVLIIVTMRISVIWIAISLSITAVISTLIVMSSSKKLINYSIGEQLRDVFPNFVLAILMGMVVWLVTLLNWSPLVTLVVQVTLGICFYIMASILLKIESFSFLYSIIINYYQMLKNKKVK